MKNLLCITLLVGSLLGGCATHYDRPKGYLNRGDKIIFRTKWNAFEFRREFNIDTNHTGRVVRIDHPIKMIDDPNLKHLEE